jgi:hypothetical protein
MEGQEYVLSVYIKVNQSIPNQLRLIAGDTFHNLDAILDNLSYALIKHNFPLHNSRECFDKNPWIAKSPVNVREMFRGLQPYQCGDDPQKHSLRILRNLSGSEKHEVPLLVVSILHSAGYLHGQTNDIIEKRRFRGYDLKNGTEIIAWASTNFKAIQNLNPHITFNITFQVAPIIPAVTLLIELYCFVRDEVITKFEPFCI